MAHAKEYGHIVDTLPVQQEGQNLFSWSLLKKCFFLNSILSNYYIMIQQDCGNTDSAAVIAAVYLLICLCVCPCVCVRERSQLVWDVSVFVLGWNASWRHFTIYATSCIPSCLCFCWQGTAADAQEKQVYVLLLDFFSSTKHVQWTWKQRQAICVLFPQRAGGDESCRNDVTIAVLTFFSVSICPYSHF